MKRLLVSIAIVFISILTGSHPEVAFQTALDALGIEWQFDKYLITDRNKTEEIDFTPWLLGQVWYTNRVGIETGDFVEDYELELAIKHIDKQVREHRNKLERENRV